MKKKIELLFLAVVVLAAGAAVILTRPSPKQEAPAQARTRPAPAAEAAFLKETTVRNVTDKTISYRIYPGGRPEKLETREIAPAEIHRFRTREHLEIEFNTGEKDVTYSLDPGKPYSFRYDEKLIDLFVGSHGRADAEDLAPYVPTPQVVVDRMLEMARVTSQDVVYDIGCGDGRIVITAARKFGARGVGIDIDPEMIDESRHNARGAGVEPLVSFICMDATKADISEATVVTLYLLPESNALLRPIFDQQLKPGTRVVSHNYEIPGWEGKQVEALSMKDEEGGDHNIFSYVR